MSLIDRVVAAVTPMESEEARREARAKARAAAGTDDWLALILQHHEAIESAFAALEAAPDLSSRMVAMRHLAVILTGHSNAEESVIYPALVRSGHKSHAMMGYSEQAGAKANMGELEYLDPMSKEFRDKLEHVRGAVAHHMYEEEKDRFLDLRQLPAADQSRLTQRFREEFERYMKAGEEMSRDMIGDGLRAPGATNTTSARPSARPPHAPAS